MIRLYSGTPGSGKSLHNAKDVINRSRFGKPVIGNFPCDLSKYPKANYTYVPNYELTPDYLMNYSREYFKGKPIREGKILLVIDECQLMFNSRDWQQKGRNAWLSFFTQHRKFGFDVTLIAQFDRMIDKQLRGVIEYEYVHRKLSNYGFGGKIMSLLFGGNTFVVVQMWYPLKLKIGQEFVHARKRFFSIYDTFGTFQMEAPSPSPAEAPAQTADVAGTAAPEVSPAEEQKPQNKRRCHADLRLLKRKLSFPGRRKKEALQKFSFPSTVKVGSWVVYSGNGKHVRRFPDNRNELGWKEAT